MKKGTHIEVRIEKVGFGGMGIGCLVDIDAEKYGEDVASLRNKKVLVQDTIPGEVVEAHVVKSKKNYIEARKMRTLTPSPHAITPRCKHFNVCGGCKWQNLPYNMQVDIKAEHVKESFTHLGGFSKECIERIIKPIKPAIDTWEYRNKVEFSFGLDHHMKRAFGFHAEGMRYDIFNLEECFLISPEMLKVALAVRDFTVSHKLTPYIYRENKGLLRNLIVRQGMRTEADPDMSGSLGERTGEILINLIISHEEFSSALKTELKDVLAPHSVTSLYVTSIHTEPGKPTKQVEELIAGAPYIHEKMTIQKDDEIDDTHSKAKSKTQTFTFQISPSSFFQTNTRQAELLYGEVLKSMGLTKDDIVLDLFCGTGTIGMFIAPHVKKVIGIELSADAVENAKVNATRNEVGNMEFIAGDVGHVLEAFQKEGRADELKGQKVVLDPPRSGLTPKMLEQVLALSPKEIVYVSCNPTTQARDIKYLIGQLSEGAAPEPNSLQTTTVRYALASLAPIDMFPHTYHIENIAHLTRIN